MIAYDSRRAWRRAATYFATCGVVAWLTDTLARATERAPIPTERWSDPGWLVHTTVAAAVIVVGYGVIWRRGTQTFGRALRLPWALGFGLAWGICEGLLLASFFVICARAIQHRALAAVTAFVVISVWTGLWHARYWDLRVVPEHNIPAYNLPKVLFVHTPNLIVTLSHLAIYGDLVVFVALQTIALSISSVVMHFPAYGAPGD